MVTSSSEYIDFISPDNSEQAIGTMVSNKSDFKFLNLGTDSLSLPEELVIKIARFAGPDTLTELRALNKETAEYVRHVIEPAVRIDWLLKIRHHGDFETMDRLEARRVYIEESVSMDMASLMDRLLSTRHDLQTLDLSGTWGMMADMPRTIWQFTKLQTLNLSGLALSSLSDIDTSSDLVTSSLQIGNNHEQRSVVQLQYNTQLPQIDDNNGIIECETTTTTLIGPVHLQHLNLSTNTLTSLPNAVWRNMRALTLLNLRGNHIISLPEEVWGLSSLRRLDLCGTGRRDLPPLISQLCNLQYLNLDYNSLREVPESIGDLKHLQSLIISRNRLDFPWSLPPTMAQLHSSLQVLDLEGNALFDAPPIIFQLTALRILRLHNNKLIELPNEIGQLVNLTTFTLKGNSLNELPESMGQLVKLQVLNLSRNMLFGLPQSIEGLTSLQHLRISGNLQLIVQLPLSICRLCNLRELHWRGRKSVHALLNNLHLLPFLEILYMTTNHFDDVLSRIVSALPFLNELHVKGTPFPVSFPYTIGPMTLLNPPQRNRPHHITYIRSNSSSSSR